MIGNISVDRIRHLESDGERGLGGAALLLSLAAAEAGLVAVPVSVLGSDLAHVPAAPAFDVLDWSGVRHAEGATASFGLNYDTDGELLSVHPDYGVSEHLTAHALAYLAHHADGQYHVCCRRPLDPRPVLSALAARRSGFSVDFFIPSANDMIRLAAPWLPMASTIFVNRAEFQLLCAVLDIALLPEVVLTDGPRPALLLHRGLETARVMPPSHSARHVAGAGDTLAGTYLAHRRYGAPPGRALSAAVVAATDYVTAPLLPIPTPRT
ncbi:PfkB family carbohydrate kinase [Streptomyces litchfieldiae]|uniref:PfkB family carbohydrate kinase n=1 Tax=Streptomyces litchfieldiae TaxID=3075543 RepID=A0ABU2MSQ7_9ACTN|nr:PfkB family carbohydrate kinase [Streptomyces sp. DSM 44938]MDT0344129.1 PfkB family carbohydrate kinase [Streptomyces sp. DSM 44938]